MALTDWPVVGKLRASILRAIVEERAPLLALRLTDGTPVNNSTALVADDVLTVAVVANATYVITGYLVTTSANIPDVKFGATIPAGATGLWSMVGGPTSETTTVPGSIDLGAAALTVAHTRVGAGAASIVAAVPKGYLSVGATAGTFVITMAQSTANVSDTTMKAGSWISLQRVS